MSRLLEYKGKEILESYGFTIPDGNVVCSLQEAEAAFLNRGPGVLKAQVYTTGRAALGLVRFPESLEDLQADWKELDNREIRGFRIDRFIYEEKLKINKEFFAGVTVDTGRGVPVLVFSSEGGSGIEEIVSRNPGSVFRLEINPDRLPYPFELLPLIKKTGIKGKILGKLAESLVRLVRAAVETESKSLEINPLVMTEEGRIVAADCHMTVDDYAVFRHPEFGIEIARELGHPPTALEKAAYAVEQNDYRGTFYFIQLENGYRKGEGVIGFHGAGGGGSMMSMDALHNLGFRAANFCDTSGNPPASKIYRAARIILAQPGIDGYFGSGSGAASQEQYFIARGLVKALREIDPGIPVVFRLGGNGEEKAISILEKGTQGLKGAVKGFGKDVSVAECAKTMSDLIVNNGPCETCITQIDEAHNSSYSFDTVTGGSVSFDYSRCAECETHICIEECQGGILEFREGNPVLNISFEEASSGKCTECLACEVECESSGNSGGRITLPLDLPEMGDVL